LGLQPDYSTLVLPGHPEVPSQDPEQKPASIYDNLAEQKTAEE
jgi:hypothetical protein